MLEGGIFGFPLWRLALRTVEGGAEDSVGAGDGQTVWMQPMAYYRWPPFTAAHGGDRKAEVDRRKEA